MTFESSVKARYSTWKDSRVLQGDILEDISFTIGGVDSEQKLAGEYYSLKYAVVMTQDCDLQWHYEAVENEESNSRSMLNTVLVCPAYPFEQFRQGTYIEGADIKKLTISGKDLKRNDKYKRYHYLEYDESLEINELIIDFKDFYTVPYDIVVNTRKDHYVATVSELFRENLSQRFAGYISRIGLPELDS